MKVYEVKTQKTSVFFNLNMVSYVVFSKENEKLTINFKNCTCLEINGDDNKRNYDELKTIMTQNE